MSDHDTTAEPSQEQTAADPEETGPVEGAETVPVEGADTAPDEGADVGPPKTDSTEHQADTEESQPVEPEPVPVDSSNIEQPIESAEEHPIETAPDEIDANTIEQPVDTIEQPVEVGEEQPTETETTEQPTEADVTEQPDEGAEKQPAETEQPPIDAEATEQPVEGNEEQPAEVDTTEQPVESAEKQVADGEAEVQPPEVDATQQPVEGDEEQPVETEQPTVDTEPTEQPVEGGEEQKPEVDTTEQPVEGDEKQPPEVDTTEQPIEGDQEQPAETEQPAVDAEPTEQPVEGGEEQPAETVEQIDKSETPAAEAGSGDQLQKDDVQKQSASQEKVAEEKKEDIPVKKEESEEQISKKPGGDIVEKDKEEKALAEPSIKEQVKQPINLNANATVKFVLMPSGQVVTLACTLGQTLKQLKDHFSTELKMPYNLILLMYDGKGMNDSTTLADLGVGPNGTVQLEMQSADPVNTPIKAYRPRQEYHMPDVITVRVQEDDGNPHEVIVEIERTTRKKPYLGGFRHKDTGIEFHNASAQTMPKPKGPSEVELFCRDTQTVQQRHQPQQTFNDMATQMTRIGVYVANLTDKLIVPNKYTSADEHLASILKQIIIIQKYYRRWLAKRRVGKLREDKRLRLEWERLEEIRKRKEKEDRIKKEFARRMNPKNKDDFDLLFHALEKWRNEELDRINSTLTGAERKAALYMLLDQETQLLSAIDRHKLEADDSNKQLRILTFLDKAASPKSWKGRDGNITKMDTPYTIRARELKDIYNSINMKYLTQDERLDVLLTLKHTVKEHDCKLTQEIIELIDREADLLMRGVKESNLDGLRKRISTLFLQYIRTPTFNPEAAKLLKVPQDPSTLRKNIYFCTSCNNYLPSTDFPLSSNSRVVSKCRHCDKIDNDGRVRQDYSHYRYMLKMLRRSEEAYEDESQIAFLLQESDLRYLVENIWNSQSTLSAWEDLFDLVLVRWNRHEEWSPWNCILLTKDEAAAHNKLHSLEEGYGPVFVHKVKQKHTLARNYFSRLPGMAEVIRQKVTQKDMAGGPSVAGKSVPVQQKA